MNSYNSTPLSRAVGGYCSEECGDDPKVNGLTFESRGRVNVYSELVQLKNVPTEDPEDMELEKGQV